MSSILLNKITFLCFLTFVFYNQLNAKTISPEQKAKIVETISASKEIGFLQNRGQMLNTDGVPANNVLYKAEIPNLNIWITNEGLTYQFLKFEEKKINERKTKEYSWHRVDMILQNANIKAKNIIEEKEIEQKRKNYYTANNPDGIFDVKTFSKITIKNIYEGIDWVLYTSNDLSESSIKYDFVVHPNANPNQIKLIYQGSGKMEIKENEIQFENDFGKISEGKLFCYQNGSEVKSEYQYKVGSQMSDDGRKFPSANHQSSDISRLTSNTFKYEVNIQLSEYDHSKELIIDPQLLWSTFYGGNDWDGAMSMDCDATNNIIVTGYSKSANFPVLNAGGTSFYQGTNSTVDDDIFIMRFSPVGVLLWSTYYGGSALEWGNTVTVGPLGVIYIVGHTTSTNFPIFNLAGAYNQAANGGGVDAVILKFSNTGQRLWATYYGGAGDDFGNSIVTDNAGNVFITGTTASANFPTLNFAGAYTQAYGGSIDAFVSRFDNAGAQVWSTFYGGNSNEEGNAICLDATGNIYITGGTASSNFPILTPGGAYSQAAGGFLDMYVIQFSNAGAHLWSTYYGGSVNDAGFSIQCDSQGNIFVLGYTESNDFPTLNATGAYNQATYGGNGAFPWTGDAFIVKFNNTQARQWATFYGGSGGEKTSEYDGIAIDACNNVYISFYTTSTNITTKNPGCAISYFDASYNGGNRDIFIAKFTNAGKLLWASYFGGDGGDFRGSFAVDNFDNVIFGGEWTGAALTSSTYPTVNFGGSTYFDNTFNGVDDSFIAKFYKPVVSSASSSLVNATACKCDGSATVVVTCGIPPYSYVWSNNSQTLNDTNNTNTISNLCPGVYTVTVSSSCNQTFQVVFNVTGPGGTNIYVTQNPVICTGQTYTLPDGSPATVSGTYIDTLLGSTGCDSIITTNLTVTNNITTTLNPVICSGQTYTFPDNSTSTVSTTYKDTLLSVGGCDSILTINLTVNPAVTSSQNQSICSGQNYILPGGDTVTVAGTYNDTLLTTSGCDSIITTNLVVNNLPNVIGGGTQNIPCNPNSVSISASSSTSGVNYSWQGPGTIINGTTNNPTVNAAGTYTVTVTDGNGCTNTATVIVTNNNPLPNVSATGTTIPCTQTSDTINASSTTSGVTYNWQGPGIVSGAATQSPTINLAGTYTVTVTDVNGCTNTSTVTVAVVPKPVATVSPDVTIIEGSSTTLTATGGTNYLWSPATGLDNINTNTVIVTPTVTTTYCVEVTDNSGCKDTACVTVSIEVPCPEIGNLKIPNAFSPNADGVNEEFCLQGWTPCIEKFQILIYNRWGEKVYESSDPNFCWDGISNGKQLDAQVFVYYIKATFSHKNESIEYSGNISLIR